jgi:hypothetical protein
MQRNYVIVLIITLCEMKLHAILKTFKEKWYNYVDIWACLKVAIKIFITWTGLLE